MLPPSSNGGGAHICTIGTFAVFVVNDVDDLEVVQCMEIEREIELTVDGNRVNRKQTETQSPLGDSIAGRDTLCYI